MLLTTKALPRILAALVAAVALGACATPEGGTDNVVHHADQEARCAVAGPAPSGCGTMGSGMMGGTGSGGPMMAGKMDKNAMCAMYREMHNAPPQQRQSMMDQQMKGMSPEMRQQHMEMMRQQCQ